MKNIAQSNLNAYDGLAKVAYFFGETSGDRGEFHYGAFKKFAERIALNDPPLSQVRELSRSKIPQRENSLTQNFFNLLRMGRDVVLYGFEIEPKSPEEKQIYRGALCDGYITGLKHSIDFYGIESTGLDSIVSDTEGLEGLTRGLVKNNPGETENSQRISAYKLGFAIATARDSRIVLQGDGIPFDDGMYDVFMKVWMEGKRPKPKNRRESMALSLAGYSRFWLPSAYDFNGIVRVNPSYMPPNAQWHASFETFDELRGKRA